MSHRGSSGAWTGGRGCAVLAAYAAADLAFCTEGAARRSLAHASTIRSAGASAAQMGYTRSF